MTNRGPVSVFLLWLFTGGIYGIFWLVWTKEEMVRQGAIIPTAWLIIIPFANLYWLWKWGEGVELVTGKDMSAGVAFLLKFMLGGIGAAIIQDKFNQFPAEA